MTFEQVKDKYDFMEWFADFACDGDTLKVEEQEDGTLTFKVFSLCGLPLVEFNKEQNIKKEYWYGN